MSAEYSFSQSGGPRHIDPEDLALYAMQFLSGEEAANVAQHLEHCAECRREIAQVRGDLALYACTVEPQSPPAQSRQRFLKQVSREKKVIPFTPQAAPIASFGRSGSILAPVDEETQPKANVGRVILGGLGWAIAAGLAVSTTALYKDRDALRHDIGTQSTQIAKLSVDANQAHAIMDALTDPKAVRVNLAVKPQPKAAPTGGATYNPDKGTLIFMASDLDPLQLYKTYELWILPANGMDPIPAGTFHPDAQGNASVIMPDIPKGVPAKGFGVTIEDDGGSKTPTMPIVLVGF